MRPSSASRRAADGAAAVLAIVAAWVLVIALSGHAAANTTCSCRAVAAFGNPGGCTVFETDLQCELDYTDLDMEERAAIANAVERSGAVSGRSIPTTETLGMEPLMERLELPFPPRSQRAFSELLGFGGDGRYEAFAGLATETLAQGFYRYFVEHPEQAGDSRAFLAFTADLFDRIDLRRQAVLDVFMGPVDAAAVVRVMIDEFASDEGVFDLVVSPGCISIDGPAFYVQFKTSDSPLEFFCDGSRPTWLESPSW